MGHVVLGYGSKRGVSELAYIFDDNYWGKGYGKESVTAVVQEYAPEVSRRYKLTYTNKSSGSVEQEEFTGIEATARPDNPASVKILESVGLKEDIGEEEKYGHNRYHFFATVKEMEVLSKSTKTTEDEKRTLTMVNN